MFNNIFLYLAVLFVNMMCCVCYVNYDLFRGFDSPTTKNVHSHKNNTQVNVTTHKVHEELKTTTVTSLNESMTIKGRINATVSSTANSINFTNARDEITTLYPGRGHSRQKIKVKQFKRRCPETERPLNIGTYEIPTQRDLVLFTKRTLLKMFNNYHMKTLYLLKDIKEATRATVEVEKKCHGKGKTLYKKCVKQVSKKCVTITKDLVGSLERQEAEVIALTEDKICNMTSMRTDPIQLIKILAMDEATLDFALPAFLRLLGGCTEHCHRPSQPDRRPRLRQLSDQDLVVRHFLTSKNYMQLIKDTDSYV